MPDEPLSDRVTPKIYVPIPRLAPDDVSLDELLSAAAEADRTNAVTGPPCRSARHAFHPGWHLLRDMLAEWGHVWRASLLVLVTAAAVCSVLFTAAIAAQAAALSLAGLGWLIHLARMRSARPHSA